MADVAMLKKGADMMSVKTIPGAARKHSCGIFIHEIKSAKKLIEFLQIPFARRVFENEFHAAFYITLKTQWESISTHSTEDLMSRENLRRVFETLFSSFCSHLTEAAFKH